MPEMKFKIIDKKEAKLAAAANFVFLLVFLALGRSLAGLALFAAYLFVLFLPGYLFLQAFDLKAEERIFFAIPTSFSFMLLLYFLSRLGIAAINLWGVLLIYILVILFQLLHSKK